MMMSDAQHGAMRACHEIIGYLLLYDPALASASLIRSSIDQHIQNLHACVNALATPTIMSPCAHCGGTGHTDPWGRQTVPYP